MNEFPIRNVEINGIHLQICDNPTSIVTQDVTDCLKQDGYNLEKIAFKPGDVVIDIGANVGIVSIYIAKKYPPRLRFWLLNRYRTIFRIYYAICN